MKKATLVLALLAVAALASDPRLMVLGNDARLLNNDYLEMWAYPGTVGDYEFVTGSSNNPGGNADGWFGMTKDFGGQTFGVTVNHSGYSHEVLYSPGGWGAILSLNYDKYYNVEENYETEMAIGLAWGTDIDLFGNYSDLALGLTYEDDSEDIEDVNPYETELGFGAGVRGHQDDFFNLFPIINVSYNQFAVGDDDMEQTMSDIMFDFGAGHNAMIAEKTNLISGAFVGVMSRSYGGDGNEDVDSDMYIYIPSLKGGVEQEVSHWLTFRAGAQSYTTYHSSGDDNDLTTSYGTYFGLGFNWSNFTLDGTITDGFLHDGPYLMGGDGSNGFLSTVAATYTF